MIVTLDFETYYSTEYSLSRMSTVDYIMDPRFETILCAVKVGAEPTEVFVGRDRVAQRFAEIDWTRTAMLAHNNQFDGAILAWRYGIVPARYLDTLSMARAMTHATIGKSSLAAVSDYLGLPPKGTEVVMARGKPLAAFTPEELEAYKSYCVRDTENCRLIFDRFMAAGFPKAELDIIDATLRMFLEPTVRLDATVLAEHLHQVRAEKEQMFQKVAQIDRSVFSSNAKFAALLEDAGVEVPTKISPATGLPMAALAKGDRAFKELCADPEQPPYVQALLAARMGAKSTLEETRSEKMLALALREWPDGVTGHAPIALKYHGAHTGRFSGDGGMNYQNLPRGSRLKEAIVAPEGYRIVHRDASQIEARGLAMLAGCGRLIEAFEQGRDVYSEFATGVYGRPISKADKPERFVGKTSILGLGYGTSAPRLRHTLFIGNGGISVNVEEEAAVSIVKHYRSVYREIPELWSLFGRALVAMAAHGAMALPELPCLRLTEDAIWLPNGLCVAYPDMKAENGVGTNGRAQRELTYRGPYGERRRIYGAKAVENAVQALSRVVITEIINRVRSRTAYRPLLTTHDSLDYLVRVSKAEAFDRYLEQEFAVRPTWAPEWPLASEGGWGRALLEAEAGANV